MVQHELNKRVSWARIRSQRHVGSAISTFDMWWKVLIRACLLPKLLIQEVWTFQWDYLWPVSYVNYPILLWAESAASSEGLCPEHFFPSLGHCFRKWVLVGSYRTPGTGLLYLSSSCQSLCFLALPSVWRDITRSCHHKATLACLSCYIELNPLKPQTLFCVCHSEGKSDKCKCSLIAYAWTQFSTSALSPFIVGVL